MGGFWFAFFDFRCHSAARGGAMTIGVEADGEMAKTTMEAKDTLDLAELTAISPIDGRYRKNTKGLAQFFSEYGLIRYRVYTEIEYFLFLMEKLPAGKALDS